MLAQKEAMKEYRHSLKHRMKLLGITHDDVVAYKHPYQNLSFGEALQALEAGKCVRRESCRPGTVHRCSAGVPWW